MDRAKEVFRLSCDCRAAFSADERLDPGFAAARSDKDRGAGADRLGRDALRGGVDAVDTGRT